MGVCFLLQYNSGNLILITFYSKFYSVLLLFVFYYCRILYFMLNCLYFRLDYFIYIRYIFLIDNFYI